MSSDRILVLATQDGMISIPVRPEGKVGDVQRPLRGTAFEAVCQDASGTFFAGSDEGRIFQSESGEKWEEIYGGFPGSRGLWALAAHPVRPKELYAGLEPASVWISWKEGREWEELSALRKHPASKNWRFYEPMKPHIRDITFNRDGTQLHVGIEEGGNLVSGDGGESFEDRTPGSDPDVHTIEVSHADANLIFLMTGGGLFRSRTGGKRWERMDQGLDRSYVVPLALLHADAKVLCVGAAGRTPGSWASTGADAAVYRSEDWGGSWKIAEGPFPLKGMIASIVIDPDNRARLFAGTNDGLLLTSADEGKSWTTVLKELPRIEEMAVRWR
jgi:photosystem II stability/assembly factor-like uncharacterized protein